MRRGLIYFTMALVVGAFSFMVLALVVEAMLRFSLPDIRMVEVQFAEDFKTSLSSLGALEHTIFFYIYALQKVWVLWLVPALGAVVYLALFSRLKREGEKRLLEHIYFLEHNLERVTKFEEEGRRRLENTQESFFQVYESSAEALIVVDAEGEIDHLNTAASQLLGRWNKNNEQFARRMFKDVVPGFDQTRFALLWRELETGTRTWTGEIEIPAAKSWISLKAFSLVEGWTFIIRETTHLHVSDEENLVGRNLLRQVLHYAPNMFAILDTNFKAVQLSHGWYKLFNTTPEAALGHPLEKTIAGFPPHWDALKKQLQAGKSLRQDDIHTTLNGEDAWLHLRARPWVTDEGTIGGYLVFVQDGTNAKLASQRLQQLEEQENKLAYNDLLTGLPNRQLFYDRLNMALAMAYRQLNKVGLLFLDLDGFKAVNDTLGHEVGDMLLKAVSTRLEACVRQSDTVSRLGGDEFTVITNVQSEHDCQVIAEKIIEELNRPFDLGDSKGVRIGTSIGISFYPQDGASANDLVRRADLAMYVSKKGGKNQFHFFKPEMEAAQEELTQREKENSDT